MKTPTLSSLVWVAIIPMWLPSAGCAQDKDEFRPAPPEREVHDVVRRREEGPGQPRPDETRREIERLRAQMIDLLNDGQGEEAAEIKQRISELERQQMRPDRPERMEGGPSLTFRSSPDQNDLQRRLRHLESAIDHLHQAGMHEPAEQLARQAERMRGQMQGGDVRYEIRRDGPDDFGPRREVRQIVVRQDDQGMREEMNDLRGEVRELRQILQELQQQLQQVRK